MNFIKVESQKLDKDAFVCVNSELNITNKITYKNLFDEINYLSKRIPDTDSPIILLFDDVIQFIIVFLACQLSSKIVVPMFFPKSDRHFRRLSNIINDCESRLIICDEIQKDRIKNKILSFNAKLIETISLDQLRCFPAKIECNNHNDISFIQYTSGSTSDPKGVVITYENLFVNQKMIEEAFGCNSASIILSWLPFYHDMGLIGNLLHSLYVGATCVLLPSVSVIQSPILWLEAISKFRATHSGGPNFAYDLCVTRIEDVRLKELDLSSWKVAYNGSEPIKKGTVDSFIYKFQKCGLSPSSLYTCYGLAEATLLISSAKYIESTTNEISSGKINSQISVYFYNSILDKINNYEGEICLFGDSVTSGYWKRGNDDLFVRVGNKKVLRTGDLGKLENNELIITGRLKEVIIVNGRKYFPYDIELLISEYIPQVEKNGVVVSYINDGYFDYPLVFVEIKKNELAKLNHLELFNKIDELVIKQTGLESYDILTFSVRKLFRTSSGKLQRVMLKDSYENSELDFIQSKRKYQVLYNNIWINNVIKEHDYDKIRDYFKYLLKHKMKIELGNDQFNENLIDLGIDSLKSVDLINTINKDLELNIDISKLLSYNKLCDFEEYVKNLIWIKNDKNQEGKIII